MNLGYKKVHAESYFRAGQEWSYKTRSVEADSTLVIGLLETHPDAGQIAHITVKNVRVSNPNIEGGVTNHLQHIPITEDALRDSVIKKLSDASEAEGIAEGIEIWRNQNGGVFSGSVADAVERIEDILTDGETVDAYQSRVERGLAYLNNFQHEEAITEFTRAIELDTEGASAYYIRGVAYRAHRQNDLARRDFLRALKTGGTDSATDFWLGNTLNALRYEELAVTLAIDTDDGAVIPEEDMPTYRKHIHDALSDIGQFRSVAAVRDLTFSELSDYAYEIITWGVTRTDPTVYDIEQYNLLENYPEESRDTWGSLGDEEYERFFTYLLKSTERPKGDEIFSFLDVAKYPDLLSDQNTDRLKLTFSDDRKLLIADLMMQPDDVLGRWRLADLRTELSQSLFHLYALSKDGELEFRFLPITGEGGVSNPKSIAKNSDTAMVESSISAHMRIWLDSATYALKNSRIQVDGVLTTGEAVSLQIDQAFGDLNADLKVYPPPR